MPSGRAGCAALVIIIGGIAIPIDEVPDKRGSRRAQLAVLIVLNGLCGVGSRWIGLNTPRGSTTERSTSPNMTIGPFTRLTISPTQSRGRPFF